ncbi:hypothetical protein BCR35DRAFT_335562 [Leucosporidium creatinivorum]|uniref:Uncharacterized protein n=1 Tax=Leucosporidium creatinivorum TaxID=106004 RepID=A0A1Y2D8Z4_9BASI|nr:hypothetical protein BCR35DRAFT_335562 [Leucosporidium creatinivorum]
MSPDASASSSAVLVEEVVETIQNGGLVDLILLLQRTEASELDARDPYTSLTPLLALLDRPRSAAQLLALPLVLLKGACTTLPEAIEQAMKMGDKTMVQVLRGEEGEDQKDAPPSTIPLIIQVSTPPAFPPPLSPLLLSLLRPQAPLRAVLLSPLPESTTESALAIRLAQSKFDVLPDNVELGRSLTQPPTPSPLPSPVPTPAPAPPPPPAPQSHGIRKRPRSPSPNPLADLLRPPQLVDDPHVLSIYNLPMTSTLRAKPTRRLLEECGLNVSEEIQSIECKNAKALVDEHGQPVLDGNGEAIGLRKYIEVAFYGFDVCEKMAKKLRKVEWEGSKLLVYRGDGRPQQIPKTNSTSSPPPMLSYRDVPPHLTLSGAPTPFAEVDHPARGDPPARYASSNQPQQVEAPNSPRGAFIHPSRQALVDGAGAGPKMESSALERD